MSLSFNTMLLNHVMTQSHEGYAVQRGTWCGIYRASRMLVHLNAKLHCTTAFGEAMSFWCLVVSCVVLQN